MNSYELLELCHYMDDDGRLKTAQRQGDPSRLQAAIFQTANECGVLRAGMLPESDGDDWGSILFLPPIKMRERQQAAEEHSAALQGIMAMAEVKAPS